MLAETSKKSSPTFSKQTIYVLEQKIQCASQDEEKDRNKSNSEDSIYKHVIPKPHHAHLCHDMDVVLF